MANSMFKEENKRPVNPEVFSGGEIGKNELRYVGLLPPGIKTIAVISPASVPDAGHIRESMQMMEKAGVRVKLGTHALEPAVPGTMSAPLEHRLEDFRNAWNDPEVDMILCTRGGKGSMELIQKLDWEAMRKRPDLPFLGYSDITLILCSMLSRGVGHPFTGPMFEGMRNITQESLAVMRDTLRGIGHAPVKLIPLVPGNCRGKVLAGHLQRLALIAGTSFAPDVSGRILFLECVDKTPMNIREYLSELRERGLFAACSGVVFCHFTRCGDPEEIRSIQDAFALETGVPVYRGFPYGHERNSYTMDYRSTAAIENGFVSFSFDNGIAPSCRRER